jgi:TPR repeat protein
MTFDPAVLAERGVVGFAPDAAHAREWYDRATKLGSTEALQQLERLPAVSK